MGIGNMTPYQKLISLGYKVQKEFCFFPPLILDYLVTQDEILSA